MTRRPATDPIRTAEPPGARRPSPCLRPRKCERRLTAITRSQSSALVRRSPRPAPMPTFSTSPSRPPSPSSAAAIIAGTSPSSLASAARATPRAPSARTVSTVSCAASRSMSATATEAPWRAQTTQIARPLPMGGSSTPALCWPPPTTSMRRPPSRWRSALSGLELTGVTVTRSGADGPLRLQLAQPPGQPAAPGHELLLQRGDLVPAAADQLELAIDVSHRLVEDLAAADRLADAASPLAPQGGPGALGAGQLAQLLERDAEQLLEVEQLAQALHVRALVEPVRARRPAAGGW